MTAASNPEHNHADEAPATARSIASPQLAVGRFTLYLKNPDPPGVPAELVDWDGTLARMKAAFLDGGHRRFVLVLTGSSGSGKTSRALSLAYAAGLTTYTYVGTPSTTVQDLTVMACPRPDAENQFDFHAGKVASGLLRGGTVILDEAGVIAKHAPDAFTPLAPVFDDRRWIQLDMLQDPMPVHPDAAVILTKQTGQPLPDFMRTRALVFEVPAMPPEVLADVVRRRRPRSPSMLHEAFRHYAAHNPALSARSGLNLFQWAECLAKNSPQTLTAREADRLIEDAAANIYPDDGRD